MPWSSQKLELVTVPVKAYTMLDIRNCAQPLVSYRVYTEQAGAD